MADTTFRDIALLELGSNQYTKANAALENLSRGISGIVSISVTTTNVTLTDADENDEAKNIILLLTGASTGARQVIVPTSGRVYLVTNNTTGGFTHTVKTAAGTGIAVMPGVSALVFCDGTNVVAVTSGGGSYSDEMAQDAVGAMVDSTIVYTDVTPLLSRAALTGDVTASAGSNATTIANDAVTYAQFQNASATARILARKTAGAGDYEEATLSEILDFITSAAQGDILYRGASTWARLPAGTSGQFLQTQGAGANPQWAADRSTQGRHTAWLPAESMLPATTQGAVPSQIETATNKNNYRVLEFADGANALYAHFAIAMPKAWDEGTMTFRVHWTLNSTSTNSAVWGLQAVARSNDDALDAAYGTAQEVTDAGLGTARDLHVSSESSAMTIAGTPAEGDLVDFRLYRDPTDGSDTLAVTAELLGLELFFTTTADTDS